MFPWDHPSFLRNVKTTRLSSITAAPLPTRFLPEPTGQGSRSFGTCCRRRRQLLGEELAGEEGPVLQETFLFNQPKKRGERSFRHGAESER